ncbi:MAG: hypothetical protein M3322_01690 [Actinomycetota bacterium]|nr:hypothetical protein [Actinomycetota bacterium]
MLHERDLATGQDVPFRFVVPEGAPPSAKGEHRELFWEVEAVSDERGLDTRASRTFEVLSRR